MNIKPAILLLIGSLQKSKSLLFEGDEKNTNLLKNDVKKLKGSGKLTDLNLKCVDTKPDYAIAAMPEYERTEGALSNRAFIAVFSEFLNNYHPKTREGILKHVLTNSNLMINNIEKCRNGEAEIKYCTDEKSGFPYNTDSGKKEYKEALGDFNKNLEELDKRLLKAVKNGKDVNSLEEKDQKIVKALQDPIFYDFPSQPFLSSLKKGDLFGMYSKKIHAQLPVVLEQDAREIERSGTKITYFAAKFVDPIAHARGKIENYKDRLSRYPKEVFDAEQPAFAVENFEKAMPDISKKMYKFLHKALSKCTEEKPKISYVEKIKGSRQNNSHREL